MVVSPLPLPKIHKSRGTSILALSPCLPACQHHHSCFLLPFGFTTWPAPTRGQAPLPPDLLLSVSTAYWGVLLDAELTGEDRIDVLSEIWDHYFTETLPTLQAIFYPVQGQELTIRQIALLGFRDLVLLKVKLEEILPLVQTKLPASIVQMLLILQSVHEPSGPTKGYLQLEELVKQVVSPYLGLCEDHSCSGSTCLLERRHSRSRPKTGALSYSSQVVSSRQPSETPLTPLTEQEGEAYLEKCGSIRRHTVANAHSDIQLLAVASMMHTGMVAEEPDSADKRLLLQPGFSHRQCSSEPSIADGPEAGLAAGRQEPAELSCTLVS
ncbi:proline-rich protein 5-like isoform X3 [Pogoniulus pusillus]|uniref:proline-rich protein 5-like isoform X3 n=1 Tax=Pogoniulus pusillus TaxID=488313 RepID=UPI0030B92177